MKKKRSVRRRLITFAIAAAAGVGLGFVYYLLVGCPGGTCPLTSNPYSSMAVGGVIGVLIAAIF